MLRAVSVPPRIGVLLALLLLAGAWLRVHELAARPMHADEANQAVKVGQLLEGDGYRFDPTDHHGPTLYYLGAALARVRGENTLAALTETTVRLVPAIAGTLAIFLLWGLAQPLGRGPALAAALFLAVSPPAVYYSRYFIQETLLVTFTLGALVCGQRWWRDGRLGWAAGAGACAGLMQATKASALLFAAAAVIALVVLGRDRLRTRGARPWLVALAAALVTAGALYSSFGTHWAGLRDAVGTLAPMLGRAAGGETGHEKPWGYYASLFLFQRQGGYVWDQTLFLLLALAGALLALRRPARFPRWAALATGLDALALSLAPYKTPWIVVNLVPGLCLLAAVALARLPSAVAVLLTLTVTGLLGWQVNQSSFLRPADSRNPFAYVHSAPDVRKVPALAAAAPAGPVKVISPEYWPLPWYLRGRAEVGYWAAVPADCDGALVFAAADLAEEVAARQHGRYQVSYLGLRPGYVLVVFRREED